MGEPDLVIVATNNNGDVSVIKPNNNYNVEDFITSLAHGGYFDIKIVYVEELEL